MPSAQRRVIAGISHGERVLDVGAGIGGPARTLAVQLGAVVTALDPTRRFCDLNAELCRRSRLDDRIEVVRGDARRMPIGDGEFDVVWTQAVWPNIDDKPAMLSEMHRVLKEGGRLALELPHHPPRPPPAHRVSRLCSAGMARRSGADRPHRRDRRLRSTGNDHRSRGRHTRAPDARLRDANGRSGAHVAEQRIGMVMAVFSRT